MTKYLGGTDNYFCCGKSGHMLRDCPMSKTQGRESNQSQSSGSNFDALNKNNIYALKLKGGQEGSPNIVTDLLQVL